MEKTKVKNEIITYYEYINYTQNVHKSTHFNIAIELIKQAVSAGASLGLELANLESYISILEKEANSCY